MQATVRTYDGATRSGDVLLDDGTPLPFDAPALDGAILMLRSGQRVALELEHGRVTRVGLALWAAPT